MFEFRCISAVAACVLVTQQVLAQGADSSQLDEHIVRPIMTEATAAGSEPDSGPAVSGKAEPFTSLESPSGTIQGDQFVLYQPQDEDERGLWMRMDDAERNLKTSAMVIRDPQLNAYVMGVLCRTVGEAKCRNVRLYLIRTPSFNASMAPNGVMEVWSGLLVRMENEAQLASILAHEYAHFEKRHTLQLFRSAKKRSETAAFLSFIPIAGSLIGIGVIAGIFSFSREMEREADHIGLDYMAQAGYDTREAAKVWERLREEMDATAAERQEKSRKDKNGGLLATHPATGERMEYLQAAAAENPGIAGVSRQAEHRAGLARWWPDFMEDQIKLNEFGATDFLLNSLGKEGWSPQLLYAKGELYRRKGAPNSVQEAYGFYDQAISGGGELAELWRGRGLASIKLGRVESGREDLEEYLRRAPDAGDRAMMTMLTGER